MNTNLSTDMNGMRELSASELDDVTGGNAFVGALVGFALNAVFQSVADKGPVVDLEKGGKGIQDRKQSGGWPFN
jgi:hypothetical protein